MMLVYGNLSQFDLRNVKLRTKIIGIKIISFPFDETIFRIIGEDEVFAIHSRDLYFPPTSSESFCHDVNRMFLLIFHELEF